MPCSSGLHEFSAKGEEGDMDRIRFGIIGAGLWGETHAKVYTDHHFAELSAVCDCDRKKAEILAEKYNVDAVYSDFNEMLKDVDIDAVAVVTPDFAHCEPLVTAANAGKHVIVEKPLATTREDAARIALEVEKSGITLMVDFHTRWSPPIVTAKDDIEGGKLGAVMSAYYRLNDTVFVPTQMLSWTAKSSVLWFLGSHTVDTLRFLFNDEVKRVFAVSRSELLKNRGIEVADLYQSILEFRSGIVATIENNWIVPNTNPKMNDIKVNILGTKGMFNMDLTNNQQIERYLEESSDHPDCSVMMNVDGKPVGFAYESIRHFVDCLAWGRNPKAGLVDGVRVTDVILSIIESAKRREPVDVVYTR